MKMTTSIELLPWVWLVFAAAALAAGCGRPSSRDGGRQEPLALDAVAESYVKLVLAVGEHDEGYVDAYYGAPEWREQGGRSLDEIRAGAADLLARLPVLPPETEEPVKLRRTFLERQLAALAARVDMLQGKRFSFDEESRALYDAVVPAYDEAHFQAVLDELDRLLAEQGFETGTLIERYEAFRKQFIVPRERLDAVFRTAVGACRERTAAHLELPEGESFDLEYVSDQAWSAYNWYQGDYRSLIQVNTDLPVYIDRVLDLACHEGYPGHHVYNAMLEKTLVDGRGWVEYTVYPLYSPQSLIAEGSANFGIEMAFPGAERLAYERDVLFPLAGLDPEEAAAYDAVRQLVERLRYADNAAARRYLDGEIDARAAAEWLTRYAAMTPSRAEQRVRFIGQYRSYVINYTLGLDLVRDWVDREAGLDEAGDRRWEVFAELLSSPRLPGGLRSETLTPGPSPRGRGE